MSLKVCLDAGHYAKYNRSPGVTEYWESERMWKLTELQEAALKKRGIAVVKTRAKQAVDMALTTRGRMSKGCDLFVSNHSNAVGSGMNESVDYPVAYVPLNGSADGIGKQLADLVAKTMGTKQSGRTATRKGSSGDYYGVIRGAVAVGTPGLILEHSFHTNTKAAKWLMSDANLKKLAEAEADCIAAYLGAEAHKEAPKEEAAFKPYMVKVTADELNIRKGPGTKYGIAGVIKDNGAYTIVEENGIWGKLKSGAGWISLKYCKKL